MRLSTTTHTPRYRRAARVLHWTMAVIVTCMVPLGIAVNYLPWNGLQDFLYNLHKSLGIVALVLIVLRLAFRLIYPAPPLPASLPTAQRLVAGTVHATLYTLMFTMPLLGWIGTNAYGEPMDIFWSVTLPAITSKDEAVSDLAWSLHSLLGLTLGGVIVVHVCAALGHRFVLRDNLLYRMWPP